MASQLILPNGNISRRKFLTASTSIVAVGSLSANAKDNVLDSEFHQGDPDLPEELLQYDPFFVGDISDPRVRADVAPRLDDFREKLIETAGEFAGMNRQDNEEEISKFCNLFRLGFTYGKNNSYTAYCACGLSYTAALAYARSNSGNNKTPSLSELRNWTIEIGQYHFYPTPSVLNMYHVALGTRRWKARSATPKPGWVVVFDWKASGGCFAANHVGLVESYNKAAGTISTIEFNTALPADVSGSQRNGGHVARRIRTINSTVKGFIDTDARNPFA